MRPPDFSPAADRDLDDILDYIAQHPPAAAVKIVDKLIKACETLAGRPSLGQACPELGADLRHFLVKPYVIFYRSRAGGVRIERVLHGARDIASALAEEE